MNFKDFANFAAGLLLGAAAVAVMEYSIFLYLAVFVPQLIIIYILINLVYDKYELKKREVSQCQTETGKVRDGARRCTAWEDVAEEPGISREDAEMNSKTTEKVLGRMLTEAERNYNMLDKCGKYKALFVLDYCLGIPYIFAVEILFHNLLMTGMAIVSFLWAGWAILTKMGAEQ